MAGSVRVRAARTVLWRPRSGVHFPVEGVGAVIAEQRDGLCTPLGTVRSSSRNAGPLGLWAGLCVVRTYVRCHVLSEVNTPSSPLVFPPTTPRRPRVFGVCGLFVARPTGARVLLVACLFGVSLARVCGPPGASPGAYQGVFCPCFLGFWGWGGGSFSSVMLFRFVVLGVVCASRVCAVFFVGAGRSPASGDVAKRAVWVAKSGGESLLS
jgi:hypothetical protein